MKTQVLKIPVSKKQEKNKYTFIIPGNPVPLARARINPKTFFNNKGCKMWDPQKELKLVAAIHLQNQYDKLELLKGPVRVEAIFFMPIPKSKSKKKQKEMAGTPHISKPDLSNLLKFIEDAATGILYHDDSLIASISVDKKYDNEPRTEFTVMMIEGIKET